MDNPIIGISWVFFGLGLTAFLVSIVFWTKNFFRARRVGILDYSMFAVRPLFLLCGLFAAVMLVMATRYYRSEDVYGFRISAGAAILFLSALTWNTGFITKKGLCMSGTRPTRLLAGQTDGMLLFIPIPPDWRIGHPIAYADTPENRRKFAPLLRNKEFRD